MRKRIYCGPPSIKIQNILRMNKSNNARVWFENKRVIYFHKTRIAIRYACDILEIGRGSEVLAPSYNCGSEIDVLLKSGAAVSLYRINKFGQIDLADLKQRINAKTKLIYITHYFGFPHPLSEITKICKEKNIYLIEDCALSLFSSNNDSMIGSIGDISVFNFPKTLPVPDGGAMLINNPALLKEHRTFINTPIWRITREMLPLIKRYVLHVSSNSKICYSTIWNILKKTQRQNANYNADNTDYPDIPFNYYYNENLSLRKISNISKYLLTGFDLRIIVERRRSNFLQYLNLLCNIKNIKILYKELPIGICPLYFPIIIYNREYICQKLNDQSICSIAWWSGYHKNIPWAEYPDACYLKNNLLVLPVHQQLDDYHIEYITKMLINIAS